MRAGDNLSVAVSQLKIALNVDALGHDVVRIRVGAPVSNRDTIMTIIHPHSSFCFRADALAAGPILLAVCWSRRRPGTSAHHDREQLMKYTARTRTTVSRTEGPRSRRPFGEV